MGIESVKVFSVTPAVEATPDYSDGDVMGGLISIYNASRFTGGSGIVSSITMSCKADIIPVVRFIFFKSNPSATTFTENSALSLNSADYNKVLGQVDLVTADDLDMGTPHIIGRYNINIPYTLDTTTTLYCVAIARSTLNLGSTSDLTINFGLLRD